jgi:hypothetical protein
MRLQLRAEDARAAFWEGLLVIAVGATGLLTHKPLLFTSLGPTAYEQCEYPHRKSSRLWNVIVGHFVAIAAGFAAVALVHAWQAGNVTGSTSMNWPRLAASTLAVAATAGLNLMVEASQPAAFSTTLLVTLGSFQSGRGALSLAAGVLVIAFLGEIVRRHRAKAQLPHGV